MALSVEEVREKIAAAMNCAELVVTGDGYHYQALIVSAEFVGLSPVKKQQKVYAALGESITSGALHALTMQTFTPEEWNKQKVFHQ